MSRVKSVKHVGKQPVYNMTVEEHHNFLIDGNVIVKNCDSLRYFCVWWTNIADLPKDNSNRKKWTEDLLEDYENGNEEIRAIMIAKYGVPHYEDI